MKSQRARRHLRPAEPAGLVVQEALDLGVPAEGGAVLSANGLYRYSLTRRWSTGAAAVFVMLNPSTADATRDDATIRRCVGFARRWGCGAVHVVNLYAWRAMKPADLWRVSDPVGPGNDATLQAAAWSARESGGPLIAAWGAAAESGRVDHVLRLLHGAPSLAALGVTQEGHPRHPLYLPADSTATFWNRDRQRAIATARRRGFVEAVATS